MDFSSRNGSSNAPLNSCSKVWVTFLTSAYVRATLRITPGNLSGPSTTRPATSKKRTSLPERLNTHQSYGWLRIVLGVQQRLPSLRETPIAFAHRGARAHAPENTLRAFSLAIALGATGLESDAWVTSDGHVVLDHDGIVRNGLRRRSIANVPRSEIPAHIPTFEEVVGEVGRERHFSLDIKDPNVVTVLASAVDRSGFERDKLWLCSPDMEVLASCGESIRGAHLVHSVRFERIDGTLERHVATLDERGIRSLNMHHTDWNGGRVTLCHRFGVNAFAWDLQYEDHMHVALLMGMDAVYSDHTDMMMRVLTDVMVGPPDSR